MSHKSTKMRTIARPLRYTSEAGRKATKHSANIEALAADARQRAIERIKSDDLGPVVDDPLGALIEGARSSA